MISFGHQAVKEVFFLHHSFNRIGHVFRLFLESGKFFEKLHNFREIRFYCRSNVDFHWYK